MGKKHIKIAHLSGDWSDYIIMYFGNNLNQKYVVKS